MRKSIVTLALTGIVSILVACNPNGSTGAEAEPAPANAAAASASGGDIDLTTDDQKAFYAIGLLLARQLAQFSPSEEELRYVSAGLADAALGRPEKVSMESMRTQVQALATSRMEARAAGEKAKGSAYAEKAASEEGATRTASGMIFQEIEAGDGDSPTATDQVKVHYTGKLIDGTVFDSSVQRGTPATFSLSGVIPCWTEAIPKMKVGGKAKLGCPSDIAYGDAGTGPIPGGAALTFEVELLSIGE